MPVLFVYVCIYQFVRVVFGFFLNGNWRIIFKVMILGMFDEIISNRRHYARRLV